MFCQSCGAQNAEAARFCNMCGTRIAAAGSTGGPLPGQGTRPGGADAPRAVGTAPSEQAPAAPGSVWGYHERSQRGSPSQAMSQHGQSQAMSTGYRASMTSQTSAVSLAGIGVQSSAKAWLWLALAAVVLLGSGAAAMYFFMSPAKERAPVASGPSVPPPASTPVEIGTPLPAGQDVPPTDFVAGGARPRLVENTRSDASRRTSRGSEPSDARSSSTSARPSSETPPRGQSTSPRNTPSEVPDRNRPPANTTPPAQTPPAQNSPPGETGTEAPDVPERDLELELYGTRVRYVIRRYYAARAQTCFDHATRNEAELRGTVVVAFTIAADGAVRSARPTRNTTGNEALGQCLASQVTTWRLPAPGEELDFEMPFSR